MRTLKIEMAHRCERLPLAVQIILYAAHDQRTSEAFLTLSQIRRGQPMGTHDPVIKGPLRLMVIERAAEGEPLGRNAAVGAAPQIHTNQGLWLETPCSFFTGFADDRSEQ